MSLCKIIKTYIFRLIVIALFVFVYSFQGSGKEFHIIQSGNLPDVSRNYTETTAGLNMEMIFVQGGLFVMGCTEEQDLDCYENEYYPHNVTLNHFYIGKFEVTQAQWRTVMGESSPLSSPSFFRGCDNCPVESISWNEAREFLEKLSAMTGKTYRFPTEAEWEYAARGGVEGTLNNSQTYKYAGSDNINDVAWYRNNSGSRPQPVGSKEPNGLGIYDMSGNVWEWCSDWYGVYGICETNPQGPESGTDKVLRGGSWRSSHRTCRVSHRNHSKQGTKINFFGLRVVCEI